MLETARKAMVPPFVVSVFADPSGSFTTAAALVACVEHHLKKTHKTDLAGKRVLILGGTGAVGRIAAVLAEQLGARVAIASHSGIERARKMADETNRRFNSRVEPVASDSPAALRGALAEAEVVLATAAAGVQLMTAADVASAGKMLIAADVNAVPPAGIAASTCSMTANNSAPGAQSASARWRSATSSTSPTQAVRADARGRQNRSCSAIGEALAVARSQLTN
jgi:methylene-tetrahydromethanopterin dehydrogenase